MSGPTGSNIVDAAMAVAIRFHNGQQNTHTNEPYILHPMRVYITTRDGGLDEIHQAVAWLHDTLEDTELTYHEIQAWFGSEVVWAVDAMTKRKGETNFDYYHRVKGNSVARRVKIHDIGDNFGRNHFIEDDATRLRMAAKYSLGMDILWRDFLEPVSAL